MNQVNQREYDEGVRAFSTYPAACPYEDGSTSERAWREGFQAAEARELHLMNQEQA